MSAEQGKDVLDGDKKEDWMNAKWRPMMGWMYMLVCTMDFVIFPIMWSLVQVIAGGEVKSQWSPITLQGAGLFHMAMGAIIGVAAFGRTQEKLAGASQVGTTVSSPSFVSAPAPAFGNAPLGGNSASVAPAFTPAPAPTFGSGKPVAPPPSSQPEL